MLREAYKVHADLLALTMILLYTEFNHRPIPARDTMTAPSVFISYSQVSADQFIAAALTCFGAPDPTAGSPYGNWWECLGNERCQTTKVNHEYQN